MTIHPRWGPQPGDLVATPRYTQPQWEGWALAVFIPPGQWVVHQPLAAALTCTRALDADWADPAVREQEAALRALLTRLAGEGVLAGDAWDALSTGAVVQSVWARDLLPPE